jgi:hypothetical protein
VYGLCAFENVDNYECPLNQINFVPENFVLRNMFTLHMYLIVFEKNQFTQYTPTVFVTQFRPIRLLEKQQPQFLLN